VSCRVTQNNNILGPLKDGTADTHIAFDSPKGFFVVCDGPGGKIFYTRDGDFTPDSEGYLRNSAGYYLMGWKLDSNGKIPSNINQASIDFLERINVTAVSGTFTQTTELDVRVNLPADALLNDTLQVSSRSIDSLGISHDVLLTYKKTANPLEWNVSVTAQDAQVGGILQTSGANNGNPYNNVTIQFDADGNAASYNGVPAELTPPTVSIDWRTTDAANTALILNFGVIGTVDTLQIKGNQGFPTKNSDNGRGFSTVEGTYISAEGDLYSVFRNSDKQKTFKIAVANFNAPNMLAPESGNAFTMTGDSGNYVLGKASEAGAARIIAGKLEGNPTNLAEELTKMIEMQHLFAGNTRSIQSEDDMLKKLQQI
jgi:flagellar hook protein FlgE